MIAIERGILACPLCGHPAETRCSRDGEVVWVQCSDDDCKTHGPTRYTETEVVMLWNTRHQEVGR